MWLNIGVAKNDGVNHIYDLTQKTEEALNQKIDSRPVGNAIENASSNPSIAQSAEKSTDSAKKVAENSAEGGKSIYIDSADYEKRKSANPVLMQNAPASTPKARGGQTSTTIIPDSAKKAIDLRKILGEMRKNRQNKK